MVCQSNVSGAQTDPRPPPLPPISNTSVINRMALRIRSFLPSLVLFGALLFGGAWPVHAQIFKLPHPDTTAGNFFGVSVSIDGTRALVGASGENVCGENSGAAYLYERDPESREWVERAKLTPSDCKEDHFFGRAVALSGDHAIVTAYRPFFSTALSNAAYVFERDPDTGQWRETAKLTTRNSEQEGAFAATVSLDGDRALITSTGDPSGGRYGGAAYVFERDSDGRWRQQARLTGSGGTRYGIFGTDGALDGNRAVVSASTYFREKPGSVYIFERDTTSGAWKEAARFGDIEDFFISVDIHGDRVIVGEGKGGRKASGEASIFRRNAEGRWEREATLVPAQPYDDGGFGTDVAIHGDRALVVGYDEQLSFEFNIDRVVYVFRYEPDTQMWEQSHIIDVGHVAFAAAIDLDEPYALIGQASEQEPGAAYVVRIH